LAELVDRVTFDNSKNGFCVLANALNPPGEIRIERFGWTTRSCRSRMIKTRTSITAI
jgi:hypothetical protein